MRVCPVIPDVAIDEVSRIGELEDRASKMNLDLVLRFLDGEYLA